MVLQTIASNVYSKNIMIFRVPGCTKCMDPKKSEKDQFFRNLGFGKKLEQE
jgi:hypothetical protein